MGRSFIDKSDHVVSRLSALWPLEQKQSEVKRTQYCRQAQWRIIQDGEEKSPVNSNFEYLIDPCGHEFSRKTINDTAIQIITLSQGEVAYKNLNRYIVRNFTTSTLCHPQNPPPAVLCETCQRINLHALPCQYDNQPTDLFLRPDIHKFAVRDAIRYAPDFLKPVTGIEHHSSLKDLIDSSANCTLCKLFCDPIPVQARFNLMNSRQILIGGLKPAAADAGPYLSGICVSFPAPELTSETGLDSRYEFLLELVAEESMTPFSLFSLFLTAS